MSPDSHDPEIRGALDSLETPALRADFHERLWARVDAAERAEAKPRRQWLARRPVLIFATALAVAAACAVLAIVNWTGTSQLMPVGAPPATAGGVLQKMKASLDAYKSMSAIFYYTRATMSLPETLAADAAEGRASQSALQKALRITPAVGPVLRARVLATNNGYMRTSLIKLSDGRCELPPEGATIWNTPGMHVQVRNTPEGFARDQYVQDGELKVEQSAGTTPGPPDASSSGWFPGSYGGQISPLAFTHDAVTKISFEGRDALAVDASVPVSPVIVDKYGRIEWPPFDHVRMVVDKATWLPVRVVRTFRGRGVDAWGFEDLRTDVPVDAADFSAALQGSATIIEDSNYGFRRIPSLATAANTVHGVLFVPTRLPAGFKREILALRTASSSSSTTTPTTSDVGNAQGQSLGSDIVSLVYRNGFRSIVITTRTLPEADSITDPFVNPVWMSQGARPDHIALSQGGMAGNTAHVVIRTFVLPHLWVGEGDTLVTVSGDVTRKELVSLAESLQPYEVAQTQTVVDKYLAATRANDRKALDAVLARGVVLHDAGSLMTLRDRREILRRNSDFCAAFIDGLTVSTLVGHRWALWEGWQPDAFDSEGRGSATAALLQVLNGRVVSLHFSTADAALRPEQLPGRSRDSAKRADQVARVYAAALKAKDVPRLAAQAAPDVRFVDVGFGDKGGAGVLRQRYERMFKLPADLKFSDVSWFTGPGWAVVRWVASIASPDVKAAGLTVLETRDGRVARETIYCSRMKVPFD